MKFSGYFGNVLRTKLLNFGFAATVLRSARLFNVFSAFSEIMEKTRGEILMKFSGYI